MVRQTILQILCLTLICSNTIALTVEDYYGSTTTIAFVPLEVTVIEVAIIEVEVEQTAEKITDFMFSIDLQNAIDANDWDAVTEIVGGPMSDKQQEWHTEDVAFGDTPHPFHEYIFGEDCHLIGRTTTDGYYPTKGYAANVSAGDMVIVNVPYRFQDVIRISKFCAANADNIGAVVIGWDDGSMNNFDNRDVSTYPQIAKNYDMVAGFVWANLPDVPVYYTVCLTPTAGAWMDSFTRQPTGWAVWNVYKVGARVDKIRKIYFPGKRIGILGMNCFKDQAYGTAAHAAYLTKVEDLDYDFSMWIPSIP